MQMIVYRKKLEDTKKYRDRGGKANETVFINDKRRVGS